METKENMEKQILLCIEWLSEQVIVKTMNMKHNSYSYKHAVERWAGTYISEDAFIEAVKIRGLPYKEESFTRRSILLPLSEKKVRQYKTRIMRGRYGSTRVVEGLKRAEF